jgi:TonB family protein
MQPGDFYDGMPEAAGTSRIWMVLLFIALVAIAAATLYQFWAPPHGEPRWASVRFDAQQSGNQLLLTWDPKAPEIVEAERGALLVNDGSNPMSISLTPEQLGHGSLPYSASSGSVLFRLRLYGKGKSFTTDSLRVITRDNAIASQPPEPPPDAKKTAPPPSVRDASPPVVRRQVQPVIPPGIRRRIESPVLVHVVVTIDETGHVTHASSSVTSSGLQRYLSDEAVRAALEWSFSPARSQDGVPIRSTKTLSFEFLPDRK